MNFRIRFFITVSGKKDNIEEKKRTINPIRQFNFREEARQN
jgi:hypothetical protein